MSVVTVPFKNHVRLKMSRLNLIKTLLTWANQQKQVKL